MSEGGMLLSIYIMLSVLFFTICYWGSKITAALEDIANGVWDEDDEDALTEDEPSGPESETP